VRKDRVSFGPRALALVVARASGRQTPLR